MSSESALAKARLRAAALARRDALDPAFRERASLIAAVSARPVLADLKGLVVSGYWPIRSEADPGPLLALARERGALVALPVLLDRVTLRFRLHEVGQPLVPAGFGTFGPPPGTPEVVPDLVIMPLAAFDHALARIGYGQGHYDRAIAAMIAAGRRPVTLGLAFATQEVDKVPDEPHDIPLDFIVTEQGLLAADHPALPGAAAGEP